MISAIIPYYNDSNIILDSVGRLLNVPDVEIIVVDDGSYEPVTPLVAVAPNVRVVRQSRNQGVGTAFDRGVKEARGETLLLMGADVMQQEGWDKHVREIAEVHPTGIVAAACVGVTPDNGYQFLNPARAGVDLRLKQDASSRGKWFADRNYNDILVAAWKEPSLQEFSKCQCLQGASYAVNKAWYLRIHGFEAHRYWGGLEPLISIKSWLAGGYVATCPQWVIGHVFRPDSLSRREGRLDWYYYNKMLIAHTCLPSMAKELISYLGVAFNVGVAKQLVKQHWAEIKKIREYNESIFTQDLSVLWD
jgi:glycosyltransferase involved in cell wall biosynthesis